MKAYFLGAGASAGTLQSRGIRVPVAVQFGSVLFEIDPGWTKKYSELVKIVNHLNLPLTNWPLEPVWTYMDYYAKLRNAVPGGQKWSGESPQLKRALLQVYEKRCDQAADSLPRDGSYTLGNFLQHELARGDGIISFNYDTVIERLARRFDRYIQPVGPLRRHGAILLAKPHGSTSWTMDFSTCRVRSTSASGGLLVDSLSPEDVTDDIKSRREPLVLGAVPIKSELIKEVQASYGDNGRSWIDVYQTIMGQWRTVVEAIRDADTLVIVGYSFPPEDQYGRFLIREAMRLRRNSPPTIEFFELPEKEEERSQAIMDTFENRVAKPRYRGKIE